MCSSKLQITEVAPSNPSSTARLPKEERRLQIQGAMERAWLQDPEQFNPNRDCIQRLRVRRTLDAILNCMKVEEKKGVDLGCGNGEISRRLRSFGVKHIDAVDVASQALKKVQEHNSIGIKTIQDCLPLTRLNDGEYDLVVCTEVIGFLEPKEYRLLFAELSRLVTNDGLVVCSSTLDPNTEHALAMFSQLAESEFEPLKWVLSYHNSMEKICRFFEWPGKSDQSFWKFVGIFMNPLAKKLRQSDGTMNFLEKFSKFFLDPASASNVIFVGKRRPLVFPLPPNEIPREHKQKRHIWE